MDAAECQAAGDAAGENFSRGWRMRATKGYVAGVGTTSALVGAIGCAFAVMSGVVAVHGWPLTLSAPHVSTVDGAAAAEAAPLPQLVALFTGQPDVFGSRRGDAGPRSAARAGGERIAAAERPVASAFGLRGGVVPSGGASHPEPVTRSGASAASPVPSAGGSVPQPPSTGAATGGGVSTPPASGGGSAGGGATDATTLGGAVTQVTSGTGTAVAQTGQQLSGAVQGATGQLGAALGQVSPAVGQTVTQTGQVVGGVVSGATSTAGQVVSGTGAVVGGLLGRLTRR